MLKIVQTNNWIKVFKGGSKVDINMMISHHQYINDISVCCEAKNKSTTDVHGVLHSI